jgi:hypothetical protein
MPRFRVLVRAENIRLSVDGQVREMVAFATRVARASSAEGAGSEVLERIGHELAKEPSVEGSAESRLVVEEVEEVPWWWRLVAKPKGFTFAVWESED